MEKIINYSGRRGDWLGRYPQGRYYIEDIRPEDLDIREIAHVLSQINRFGGRSIFPWSVANHSVLCCEQAKEEYKFACLMHDVPESVIGDLCTPFKRMLSDVARIEGSIDKAVQEKFGYVVDDFTHLYVKEIDMRALATEVKQVVKNKDFIGKLTHKPFRRTLKKTTPLKAERQFLELYELYKPR